MIDSTVQHAQAQTERDNETRLLQLAREVAALEQRVALAASRVAALEARPEARS